MSHRPLTEEEFAVAGVSMTTCGKCGAEKRNDNGWVYYRQQNAPQVLCWSCFDKAKGRSADDKAYSLGIAAPTYRPLRAAAVPGITQRTHKAVEQVFQDFRALSPAKIRSIAFTTATAKPGDCLEWYGPVRWFDVLDCLKWLREIHDMPLRFLFGRWEKLPSVLNDKMAGTAYEGWRSRLTEFAKAEFLYRYSVLLSDAIEAAHKKTDGKKAVKAKQKIFEACKASVCEYSPPESLAGAADELERFVDYMNIRLARLAANQ
jgi:hypothetical protein